MKDVQIKLKSRDKSDSESIKAIKRIKRETGFPQGAIGRMAVAFGLPKVEAITKKNHD